MRRVHCPQQTPEAATRCPSCRDDPRLEGRYLLLDVIGRGATGTLYRARDAHSGREVAIKERHPSSEPNDEAMFEREARVLRQLDHPRIPHHLAAFRSGAGRAARHYLVQELIDGISLQAEQRDHRYTAERVWSIVRELAEILTYLHALSPPVIHRDLKPSNVLRRRDGALVLVDFGAVRDHLPGTLGGATVAGTFGFMAPEQFMGEAEPASDVYALGALAVALLSQRDPASLHDRLRNFEWEQVVAAPEPLRVVLRRMLSEAPSDRPSAEQIAQAARPEDLLDGSSVAPRPNATADADALRSLAARGRAQLAEAHRAALLAEQREAAAQTAEDRKRLREAVVGPVVGFLLRQQHALSFLATLVSLLGGAGLIALLMQRVPLFQDHEWLGLPVLFGSMIGGTFSALWLTDAALAALATWSGARERASLASLPFPVEWGEYRQGLASFHHEASVQLRVRLATSPSPEQVRALSEALVGARLGGAATAERDGVLLVSPTIELTTWHGKRLESVISHHSLLHRWTRGVLRQLLVPAARDLGITSVHAAIIDR